MAKVKKAVDAAVDASRSVKSALNDILDMSTEARKAKAAEQGYSGGLYHGTDSDIKEYSGPTWLTDNPKDASQYSDRQAWFNQDVEWDELGGKSIDEFSPKFDEVPLAGQNVQPLMTRAKNTLDISDLGPETTLDDVVNALVDYEVLSEKPSPEEMIDWIDELNMRNDSMTFVGPRSTHPTWAIIEGLGLDKDIQSSGWDALKIADIAPDGRTMSGTLVFDPKNIRSVNAAFDPAKRESANLLAGLGGAAVLGASVEDAEASFGGVLAKNADALMLSLAEEMKRLGKPRDEIWRKTGWMEGPDNKWRFEIDDSGATYRPDFGEAQAGDVISHGNLYANYPDMAEIRAKAVRPTDRLGGGRSYEGAYSREGGLEIHDDLGTKTGKSTALHELQHAIQDSEGFAKGGSPSSEMQSYLSDRNREIELTGKLNQMRNQASDEADFLLSKGDGIIEEARAYFANDPYLSKQSDRVKVRELLLDRDALHSETYKEFSELRYGKGRLDERQRYNNLAGEAEARNVQTRINMTPDERRATPPWETLDVPESEQIVRMKGFADPMTLAVTAAITGAASEFYRRRESKQSFWQQRREELSELINAGDEFIRPAMPYINSALEALDKPMQGYYGVASALGALVDGNGLDASLQRGATVARQPIEETAQEYGGVLADEGYPLAGTALNTAMQVTGPF